MKRFLIVCFSLLLMLEGLMGWGQKSLASEVDETYSIFVVKYKLEEPEILTGQLPLNGVKAGEIKDKQGNQLEPLAGISYEVTRVSPVQGSNRFEATVGDEAFCTTITTDVTGIAHFSGLAQGMYRVVEEEHSQLREVMEPVVLELPLPQASGKALPEVYLYPKSGVKPIIDTNNSESGISDATKELTAANKDRIPQTSGNIGSYHSLILVLSFILIMTLVGFRIMKNKKFDF
ncbi:cell wall protein [Enterococcus hulanensis]|uniref:pilin N-terminal domain-containing protein n=1 Tax=Enterococcus hulanensis TaxID=2559929 RepID=UPI001A8E7462|nr:pilin N-terminal domain-containing protein [Enterococcus hulanensis]MBO0458334.1 cell wall protein [Enterococcus hulanensis]